MEMISVESQMKLGLFRLKVTSNMEVIFKSKNEFVTMKNHEYFVIPNILDPRLNIRMYGYYCIIPIVGPIIPYRRKSLTQDVGRSMPRGN